MQQPQMKTEFKGGMPKTQRQLFLVLEFTMALTCLMLMGPAWLRLYLFFAAASLPGLSFAYWALSYRNWFRLDDAKSCIEIPLKQNIPYQSVRAIHITEFENHISVSAQKGKLDRTPLVQNLKPREKWRLLEELKKRFPEEMIRETKFSQWKLTMGFYLAPFLPCVFLLMFTYYISDRYPQASALPRKVVLPSEFASSGPTGEFTVDSVTFKLPADFTVEEQKDRSILLESAGLETDLRVYV